MKELSIEQKAKRYDEALERVKELLSRCTDNRDRRTKVYRVEDIESIFPELKENDDERVKRILYSITSKMGFHIHDIFTEEEFQCFDAWSYAWLEKQDKKTSWTKTSDQEKIAEIPFGAKDSELQEATYYIPKGFHAEIDDDKVVIKKGEKSTSCLEKQGESDETKAKMFLVNKGYPIDANGIFPTYEEMYNIIREGLEKQVSQKPTEWSEEDEHRVKDTIYFLDTAKKHYASTVELDACIDWLKSLKQRIGG